MSPRRAKAVGGRVGDDPATALRLHLIETAVTLLGERQLSAITTREIARAAGVSDGVLYNYFHDKDELLLTALVRRYHPLVARADVGLPQPGSASVEENLCAYASATLDIISDALPMAAGLINDPAMLHRFLAAIHQEPLGPHNMPVTAYLLGEQKLGRVSQVDVEVASTLLLGSTIALAFTGLFRGIPREELAQEIPRIVAVLSAGLHQGQSLTTSPGGSPV